jgi:hypothetical protein
LCQDSSREDDQKTSSPHHARGRGRAPLTGTAFGPLTPPSAAAQTTQRASEAPRIRRVVTGHNAQGGSFVLSDELVPVTNIWVMSASEPVGAGTMREKPGLLPTNRPQIDPLAGGTRWTIATISPARDPTPTLQNRQGFHRTATIDYVYVLSGDVVLLLDEQEVRLQAGDAVIQLLVKDLGLRAVMDIRARRANR